MSEQGWSPEPWTDTDDLVKSAGYAGQVLYQFVTIRRTDWERAKQCVNALAGIPDPAALVESHAELLNWAKEYHGAAILMGMGYGDRFDKMIARAEAARGRK